MVSFQQDLIFTLNQIHKSYTDKYSDIISDEQLLSSLNLDEAGKLIEYIKEYREKISSTSSILDKMINIKQKTSIDDKIEDELSKNMIPIMMVYRNLLSQKYSSVTDLD